MLDFFKCRFFKLTRQIVNTNKIFYEIINNTTYISIKTMKNIRDCLMNKNTSVMARIMIYEMFGQVIIKVDKVLSCVVYTIIDNYVCIDCL